MFRIGGDEFAVIVQGEDYTNVDALVQKVEQHNRNSFSDGGITIACGMARFAEIEKADKTKRVFELADKRMYENKSMLKTLRETAVKDGGRGLF